MKSVFHYISQFKRTKLIMKQAIIPKKPGATAVDTFRPICLQNCSIKILAKALTRRLQKEIGKLIDLNQSGFLKGRSISETFIFCGWIGTNLQEEEAANYGSETRLCKGLRHSRLGWAGSCFASLGLLCQVEELDSVYSVFFQICCA